MSSHVRLLAGLLVGLLVCLSVCQSPSPPPVLTQEIKCYKHQSLSTTGGQTLWPIEVLYAKIRRGNFRGKLHKLSITLVHLLGNFLGRNNSKLTCLHCISKRSFPSHFRAKLYGWVFKETALPIFNFSFFRTCARLKRPGPPWETCTATSARVGSTPAWTSWATRRRLSTLLQLTRYKLKTHIPSVRRLSAVPG